MSKKQIISFIEDAKILEKMKIFHEKKNTKALKSIVHEAEEEGVVPEPADLKRLSVSKLRKMMREFHRDIGLKQKHAKMSASKLRSFVSRNRYQEMLYGDDDMTFLMQDDEKKGKVVKEKPSKKGREREGIKEKVSSKSDQVSVNVYTGKAEPKSVDATRSTYSKSRMRRE